MIRADAPDPRAALESVVGPVVWFEIEQAAEPAAAAPEPAPPLAETQAPTVTPGRVVPFPPSAIKELDRLQRIMSAAGRLADLSGRLERARPPPSEPGVSGERLTGRFAKVPA